MRQAPEGFKTVTMYYDGRASRKGDRVWKVVLPLNADVVEHVRVPLPGGPSWEGDLTDRFEEALKSATDLVRAAGVEPDWTTFISDATGAQVAVTEWNQEAE